MPRGPPGAPGEHPAGPWAAWGSVSGSARRKAKNERPEPNLRKPTCRNSRPALQAEKILLIQRSKHNGSMDHGPAWSQELTQLAPAERSALVPPCGCYLGHVFPTMELTGPHFR